MNCNDFQYWLLTRDVFSNNENQDVLDHLQVCDHCKALYNTDLELEKRIQTTLHQKEIPKSLYDQIDLTIDHAKNPVMTAKQKIAGLILIVALIFIVTVMAFFNKPFRYQNLQQLSNKAIVLHLKGNTTMSFSADEIKQATVMMSQKLKFNVAIPDFKDRGYKLLGGRLCVLGDCNIAYLFYERQNKICSLVIMDYDNLDFKMADGSSFSNDIKGCHTDIWKEKGQVYAMVY